VPLLSPSDEDREGYVPNVVYTCGAIVHGGRLFMPYGVADTSVSFAWIEIADLLAALRAPDSMNLLNDNELEWRGHERIAE
jgi:predicted GH43/DUF377 family glycosyl hydrolase